MKWDPHTLYCVTECLNGKVLNTNTQVCECPSSLPYWNGLSCVSCKNGEVWNAENSECIRCPEGFIFNYATGQCEDQTPEPKPEPVPVLIPTPIPMPVPIPITVPDPIVVPVP